MATRRRPSMSDRIEATAPNATVTPIKRGRDAFTAEAPATGGEAVEIPIGLIDPSPSNPRSTLGDLEGLVASIKELGVLQPVLVRRNGERYDLIYGHRRLEASKLAKRKTVPAFFTTEAAPDEVQDRSRRLVENLHREDLTALDEARAYQELLDLGVAGGQRGLAKLVGKSQAHVSKRLALLKLPEDVRGQVDSGGINVSDAVELAKLADDPELVNKVVKRGANAWGGITQAVKRELEEIEDRQAREKAAADLRAAGVTVTEDPVSFNRRHGPYPLRNLGIDVDEHAKFDCHGAVLPSHGSSIVLVCFDPAAHSDSNQDEWERQRAQEQAERQARQEARRAAATARFDFATTLVRKGAADAGPAFLLGQLLGSQQSYVRLDDEAVAQLLGINPDTYNGAGASEAVATYAAKGTRNAHRAAYAAGLVLGESAMMSDYDYRPGAQRAYLDHLVACGYALSEFEKALLAEAEAEEGAEDDDLYDEDLDEDQDETPDAEAEAAGDGGEA